MTPSLPHESTQATLSTTSPTLPLRHIAHVSFNVPQPFLSAMWLSQTLGLSWIKRPQQLGVAGVWLKGLGLEIHLVQGAKVIKGMEKKKGRELKVTDDHLAFLADGLDEVKRRLRGRDVSFVERVLDRDGMEQVRLFFFVLLCLCLW
eukprot:Plantae.Rhodophyta-Hildenbrandia_rubra.ctg45354.p1 GENE.Plantae.Rhodophyta-Hildenbrandia_rubra.ctg45354~~Plantae.Rhodophyta-Hildenbrandia_rubra.ctg45354.p1  ORF type:complete len:164 (-),score=19.45 Plantae.Rhodophyta-Hildenbrandia_rubra.ctg45354:336-776(-)